MFSTDLLTRAEALVALCRTKGLMLATAESCTGGLLAALLTEVTGSSAAFDRGFVTYSNQAKMEMLGVPDAVLAQHGAVSEQTARAMAEGAVRHSAATLAVSVTGIAGPGGGSDAKPVGLVHFGCCDRSNRCVHVERRFTPESRRSVRMAALAQGLALLEQGARGHP